MASAPCLLPPAPPSVGLCPDVLQRAFPGGSASEPGKPEPSAAPHGRGWGPPQLRGRRDEWLRAQTASESHCRGLGPVRPPVGPGASGLRLPPPLTFSRKWAVQSTRHELHVGPL